MLADVEHALLHVVRSDSLLEHRHPLDTVHVLVRELENPLRERRRVQKRLTAVGERHAPYQEAEIVDEAHVEHAVGFVDDEDFGGVEPIRVLLEVVDQTAGRADEDVHSVLQALELLGVVDASVHGVDREAAVAPEELRLLANLDHELARRRDDQRARARDTAARRLLRRAKQAGEGPDEVRRGLARSRLRLTGDVVTGERQRQSRGLNGRAVREARVGDAASNFVWKI